MNANGIKSMKLPQPTSPLRPATVGRDALPRVLADRQVGPTKLKECAFTLMELLIVLAIMGLLASIALPAMKGIQKSNTIANATHQLIADLSQARQTAIREQTTVHVIFVPTNIARLNPSGAQDPSGFRDRNTWTNLLSHAYSSYALFVERSVGDQPGTNQWHARYIGQWRTLPDGVIIADWEFEELAAAAWDTTAEENRSFKVREAPGFPFPTAFGNRHRVPYLSFDSKGGLVVRDSRGNRVPQDEVISLARASVFVRRNPVTGEVDEFDVRESPPGNSINNYNRIRIDGLTGRARAEQPKIQ